MAGALSAVIGMAEVRDLGGRILGGAVVFGHVMLGAIVAGAVVLRAKWSSRHCQLAVVW